MKSKLYCKILALCVVCSFIGIGIQPAFAEYTNPIALNENENPNPTTGDIYENTNCLVIIRAKGVGKWPILGIGLCPILIGDMTFGSEIDFGHGYRDGGWANGWIFTINSSINWRYDGYFGGTGLGVKKDKYWFNYPENYFIGVKNFRGLAYCNLFNNFIYTVIGYADIVKIRAIP